MYRIFFIFDRRGENGFGRCNHVGGIIFAVEDFTRCGLKEHDVPVSCTSRLCGWNVPRNIRVDAQPIDRIVFKKIKYGKKTTSHAKITAYDPRAPSDRSVNTDSLKTLGERLSSCLQSSSFFLFYNIQPNDAANVEIDSISAPVPEDAIELHDLTTEMFQEMPFSDDYNISSKAFKVIINCYVKAQTITEEDVERIEKETRGQSENDAWKKLKETVLTASNFKKAAIRRKEPDALLKDIMYLNTNKHNRVIPSLEYGNLHEQDAVDCYVAVQLASGNTNLRVVEVGTKISKENPGLGASLDRLVYDPSSTNEHVGGLEVKCPYSKRGMTVEEACSDGKFYLSLLNDEPVLKMGHAYYYQIQGQMYVCQLKWVDFVVWFGNDVIAVERIMFNRKWWTKQVLPSLLYFYKRAFLPEVFTRRVKRDL